MTLQDGSTSRSRRSRGSVDAAPLDRRAAPRDPWGDPRKDGSDDDEWAGESPSFRLVLASNPTSVGARAIARRQREIFGGGRVISVVSTDVQTAPDGNVVAVVLGTLSSRAPGVAPRVGELTFLHTFVLRAVEYPSPTHTGGMSSAPSLRYVILSEVLRRLDPVCGRDGAAAAAATVLRAASEGSPITPINPAPPPQRPTRLEPLASPRAGKPGPGVLGVCDVDSDDTWGEHGHVPTTAMSTPLRLPGDAWGVHAAVHSGLAASAPASVDSNAGVVRIDSPRLSPRDDAGWDGVSRMVSPDASATPLPSLSLLAPPGSTPLQRPRVEKRYALEHEDAGTRRNLFDVARPVARPPMSDRRVVQTATTRGPSRGWVDDDVSSANEESSTFDSEESGGTAAWRLGGEYSTSGGDAGGEETSASGGGGGGGFEEYWTGVGGHWGRRHARDDSDDDGESWGLGFPPSEDFSAEEEMFGVGGFRGAAPFPVTVTTIGRSSRDRRPPRATWRQRQRHSSSGGSFDRHASDGRGGSLDGGGPGGERRDHSARVHRRGGSQRRTVSAPPTPVAGSKRRSHRGVYARDPERRGRPASHGGGERVYASSDGDAGTSDAWWEDGKGKRADTSILGEDEHEYPPEEAEPGLGSAVSTLSVLCAALHFVSTAVVFLVLVVAVTANARSSAALLRRLDRLDGVVASHGRVPMSRETMTTPPRVAFSAASRGGDRDLLVMNARRPRRHKRAGDVGSGLERFTEEGVPAVEGITVGRWSGGDGGGSGGGIVAEEGRKGAPRIVVYSARSSRGIVLGGGGGEL